MSATILVTGGAGFIGSHSVDQLLSEGHHVRVLDNFSSGKRHNLPEHPRLEIVAGDVRNRADVERAMDGVERCLHLAAQVSVARSVSHPDESAQHNVMGTLQVLHAACLHGLSRVVYASSAAVYGTPESLPLNEGARLRPLSPYGLEKWINERYASLQHQLHGLSSLGFRYFNVYGPRQDPQSPYAGVIALFVDALRHNHAPTIFGDGGQTRDFVFVADVARMNARALFSDHQGVCNLATGKASSLMDLIAALNTLLESQQVPRFAPPRSEDIRHSLGATARLHKWFGLTEPRSLEDGLKALIEHDARLTAQGPQEGQMA
ncbi:MULTISPECIES: NAD-dependent epimerase/dehydratase family protein [unclassified Halomonas]|uniref:NAD-dependent epimerase/dehydratase family protein n=1 Tax=unclassified Halomonas TaxID=2609666 RepID=UPI000C95C123|nr:MULTISPECIES: NAD-dependent epimerase/dehydratase family protein [unclassified Halomonas]MAR73982.1 hypothetical protein [Halomonas sp.]|tara:strand:- start:2615 stop:3574 length:960 start_codon:yes stop_codon:yes gene_type:complete